MISRPFLVALILLVLGLGIGALRDPVPARPPVFRAGFRVLEADLHAHTTFSDGVLSPFDVVVAARRAGLDAVAITEHNQVFPAQLARAFGRFIGGPTVIVGEEVTSSRFHMLAYGIEHRVPPSRDAAAVIDAVHAQGGLAFAAHPALVFQPSLLPVRGLLDGSEVIHPLMYASDSRAPGFRWDEMRDYYLDGRKLGQRLTAIASSDSHAFALLGLCRTFVFARGDGEAAILEALHDGRTVVFDRDGHAYGDASLIAALEREPLPAKVAQRAYASRDPVDWIGRACGLFGALGICLLRARPRERKEISAHA